MPALIGVEQLRKTLPSFRRQVGHFTFPNRVIMPVDHVGDVISEVSNVLRGDVALRGLLPYSHPLGYEINLMRDVLPRDVFGDGVAVACKEQIYQLSGSLVYPRRSANYQLDPLCTSLCARSVSSVVGDDHFPVFI